MSPTDTAVHPPGPPATVALPRPAVTGLPSPDRPLIMGVLNVTPDSFSDGGAWLHARDAIDHAVQLVEEGADLIDVGGESTRPGAVRTPAAEELRRVLPVVEALTERGIPTSVDTMRAGTASRAIAAGACLINDVSGGLADPAILGVVADAGVGYVAMHWRGPSSTMQSRATYDEVAVDVAAELQERISCILAAGVRVGQLIIDPGLGFGKTSEHNWQLLAGLDRILGLGYPTVIGASRKTFLGDLLADADPHSRSPGPRPPRHRDDASVALTALLAHQPIWAFRTHTARPHRDAIAVAQQLHPPQIMGR